ncbi:MAG: non-canonical purine NTP pyrophosphatase [Clostridia bacterium]|nr:non-canonical purine NTP pyrophosphatase [Clostridia bacterium]
MKKQVLLGTTNPSKVKRFRDLLAGYEVEFFTLADRQITQEPEETGATPEENARIKARFYGEYFDAVICNDSGLYFADLPLNDPRQPGLNIRAPQGRRLNDEEMISYYADLIGSLGGRASAFYLDGVAVYNKGKIYSFMDPDTARKRSFDMVSQPSEERNPGWPLDSLSRDKRTGLSFTDGKKLTPGTTEENVILGAYRKRLTAFLAQTLGLNNKEE